MPIEIYSGQQLLQTFSKVTSAALTDKLSGERTFDFSVITSSSLHIDPGQTVKHDGQFYNISRVARGLSGNLPVSSVSCEHISNILNNEEYNLVTFVFEGTPAEGLTLLLNGTPFSAGIVEPTANVAVAFTEGTLNRRNALMRFIDACGGEIEYDGYSINIRSHRGSTVRKTLMDGENVTDVAVTLDASDSIAAYEISLFKTAELEAGDEVNITFSPLGINVDTRIVGITYNPFYRYSVRVEVGAYIPNLVASTSSQLDKIKQEFKAADGALSSIINGVEGEVSMLTQDISSISTRITDVEGSISTIEQTALSLTTRITDAEGQLSEVEQTADKINWIVESGTSSSNFALTSRTIELVAENIDMTGYVTFSSLEASGETTINGDNITTGTLNASFIALENEDGGFCCASGYDGVQTTYGAKMFGSDSGYYFIATNAGVRMTAGNNTEFYCTDTAIVASQSIICASDSRIKNSVAYDMNRYNAFFMSLKPCYFKLNDGTSGRYHTGFISQDVQEALANGGITALDFAGFTIRSQPDEKTGIADLHMLRYSEFISLNTYMIQQLYRRIEILEIQLGGN